MNLIEDTSIMKTYINLYTHIHKCIPIRWECNITVLKYRMNYDSTFIFQDSRFYYGLVFLSLIVLCDHFNGLD